MSILFNESNKLITLQTANSSYQMKIDEYGYLLHTWYGEKIDSNDDMSYRIFNIDRGFSGNPYETLDRTYSLDFFPQEYACFGNGDYRADAIQVIHPNGANTLDLRYESHEIINGKYELPKLPAVKFNKDEGYSLKVILKDSGSDVRVELLYSVISEYDVITRAVRVINNTTDKIILNKALSLSVDFLENDYDFIHFYGKHAMEREFERNSLIHGKQSIGSIRGTSSHHHNPFVILAKKEATETMGFCYGFAFVYSGSFICEAEVDQVDNTRLLMGIHHDQFRFEIASGEDLYLPEVICVYSNAGFESLSHKYHDLARKHILQGEYVHKHRPILINNWEATYFDFDTRKLVDIAKDAKEMGLEMLVMDDGWFGERFRDDRGLGDWVVNEEKLGSSLKELVDEVNNLGLKFGIWFEPEMINENSDLYRKHPDWAISVPGRLTNKGREQFVLDFTRDEVRDEIERMMRAIIEGANIEYIKWDMNRSITNLYSATIEPDKMGEFHYKYVLGLYDLLEKITSSYPHILFEGCSGGGGRFDYGMLYYHPQIWCSDNTDAIERLKIQYGTSFAYPIGCVGSHVSASPNHQTFRVAPLETRGTVAMAGSFGYELDLTKLTEEEHRIVKSQIEEYKKYDELVHEGDYYRLNSPYDNTRVTAWEFMSKDKSKGLLSIVVTSLQANPAPIIVYPRGLIKDARYRIGNEEKTGASFIAGGYKLPVIMEEYQSFRLEIEKL